MERFDDGVFFVDLVAARDADAMAETIVRALDVPRGPQRRPLDSLAEHLQTRHTLLVLDNFEQLVEAAGAVRELLQASEGPRS
jgi:non-specific serine/threonine protein kinase